MGFRKRHLLIVLVLATAASIAFATPKQDDGKAVVIHIGSYSNDPNSTVTALILATNLQRNGADISLFLDREGVRLADSRAPSITFGGFDSAALLSALVKGGARAVVCPPGAAMAGVDANHLREGAQIGPGSLIAEMFLSADVVVDY